jgi:single stranded DNA-binding protein
MPFLNQCAFMGHVGHSASLKTSKDGSKQWAEFSLAVSTGSQQMPKTMWIKCRIFGKGVEKAKEKVFKGDTVYVSGKIDASAYLNKAGQAAVDVSMFVNEWQLLKSKNEGQVAEPTPESFPQFDSLVDDLTGIPF